MEKALKLIIARSPNAANEALNTLSALRTGLSATVSVRYEQALQIALNDPEADWTADERGILAAAIELPEDGIRSFTERFRVTNSERAQLAEAAQAAGQTKSEYIRSRIFA